MNKVDTEIGWIDGCEQWIREHRADGWVACYLNFMFEPLKGTTAGIIDQMKIAIYREFYVPFMLQYVRNPHRKVEQASMPRLMLYPDRPVAKCNKASMNTVTINGGGLHYNGPMLVPTVSRFFDFPVEHIMDNQRRYAKNRIARVHAVYLDDNVSAVASYSAKTVKWGRADFDDILILPKSSSEFKQTTTVMTPDQRAIKDIVSAQNVSAEQARLIYLGIRARANADR